MQAGRAFVLSSLAACMGCGPHVPRGTSQHSVNGPTGAGWIAIECSDQQKCFERAGTLCPSGYDLATSGGETEVYGNVHSSPMPGKSGSLTSGSIWSEYHGHMLIKCTSSENWQPVYGPSCRFRIPADWKGETIDGRKVFHPIGAFGAYAFLDVHPFAGSLESYPTEEISDGKVEEVEIDGRTGLFATKVEKLNAAMVATAILLDDGKAYELTCVSPTPDAVSPTCRRVITSLHLGPNPTEP